MKRVFLSMILLVPVLTSCAVSTDPYPSASPDYRDDYRWERRAAYRCERNGGIWRPHLNVCEMPDRRGRWPY
jgi:hypothetical protein